MNEAQNDFTVARLGDVDVVRLSQPKMAHTALDTLQKDLSKRIDGGSRKMVVNLAPLAFLDSFGIGVIAATARRMAQAGGALRLCGVGERVKMSLTITRLDRTLDIHPDEEAALRSFGGPR